MRILHCILSKDYAGSEAYCCRLASMQAADAGRQRAGGQDSVGVLAKDNGRADYLARLSREAAPAMLVTVPKWWPSIGDVLAIASLVRAFAPDLVHTHLGRATRRAGRAARRQGIAHVATLHLDWRNEYAACDGILCIAEWQKKLIPPSYRGHVGVVWNWAPPPRVRVAPRPASSAPGMSARSTFTFLTLGRLVPQKGMDVLINAFRRAFPTGLEPVRCLIVGDGPQRTELNRLARGEHRIRLLGHVDDVDAIYEGAHVYVSAARYEPFGLTILEAMRAGCRVICTRTQGPVEFLAQRSGVAWADAGDVDSLSAALRQAAAAGRERMDWDLTAFDGPVAQQKIAAFYQSVLRRQPTPACPSPPSAR
jgi:glycosyltransferase involved in cell wall biosynthesis